MISYYSLVLVCSMYNLIEFLLVVEAQCHRVHCLQLWQRWQDVILQVECLRIQESRVPEGGLWWSVPYIVLH